MAEAFPFYLPAEARRLYTSDGVARRIALTAHWTNTARVLELFGSTAGIALAKELGCDVTLADSDDAVLKALESRVASAGVSDRVKVAKASMTAPSFPDGSHDGVLVLGRLLMPLDEAATKLRKILALRGRLVLTWPVRVGLRPNKAALEFWEKRVGQPLKTPRECLIQIEKHGYEPETIETPSEADLDEYYKSIDAVLGKAPPEAAKGLQQEVELHRDTGGKSGVTLALMVVRRKEPGERPPPARMAGSPRPRSPFPHPRSPPAAPIPLVGLPLPMPGQARLEVCTRPGMGMGKDTGIGSRGIGDAGHGSLSASPPRRASAARPIRRA